jgi:uncharacterized protein
MVLMLLTKALQERLLGLAKQSIQHGLQTGKPISINLADFPPELSTPRATFVTLHIKHKLRGCIGILTAQKPLAQDIADNAFAAAFRDSRFPPLSASEFEQLEIHLSLLTAPEPIGFVNEMDLLKQLKPGIDGLILEEGGHRATFLPSVWESLPEKKDFLRHLKQKAGLPSAYWSGKLRFFRYRTELIE